MKPLTASTFIQAAPERVFDVFSQLADAPQRIRGITKLEVLTPGPIGVGTRFRETRKMMGMEATEEMEITAFDPPHGYSVGCTSHGCEYRTVFTFKPEHAGTQVEMVFSAQPRTTTAKVMGALTGWMMTGSLRKCLEEDLADLKTFLEKTDP